MTASQEFDSLVSLNHYGPVTSIQFHENYLIAGCGPSVKIYDWRTSELICTRRIFSRNKIHGITINKITNQVAFWGGRSLAFSHINQLVESDTSVFTELALNDWIMHSTFPAGATEDEPSTLAYILTAHNMVVSVEIENGLILENTTCGEKSILYSGVILALEDGSDVLIGAGTVMSGVVIWSLNTKKVLNNLTNHEGSIFGVRFSDDGKSLISCSDDRSIRLWDVTSGQEVAVGWGHLARIWDLHFYHDKIISVSEDSTARIWAVDLSAKQLITDEVWEGHLGKNAWCGSIQFEHKLFATAGGDGRVRLWQIDEFKTLQDKKDILSLGDVVSCIDPKWIIKKNEIFKNYVFLNNGKTVFTTSSGKILVSNSHNEWRICYEDRSLDGYSTLGSWDEENIIVASGRDGSLILIGVSDTAEDDTILKIENVFTSKISEIFTWKNASFLYILSETQNPKDSFIIHKIESSGYMLTVKESFKLEPPVTFNITSVDYDAEKKLLVAGSRHGAITVYDLAGYEGKPDDDLIKPTICWRRVLSADDKISTLSIAKKENDSYIIFLTSKGGAYSLIQISYRNDGEITMQNILLNKIHRGSIEGGYYSAITNRMILYGFRNNLFFVWNESEQYEIMKELCGGSHRIWTFKMNDFNLDGQYVFAYTKASQVCILRKSSQLMAPVIPSTLLQDGLHGREVRCVSFAPKCFDANNKTLTRTVATAAEDTCIRLNHVSSNGQLKGYFSYRKHVSGLQQLRWSPDGNYLISSAAREELFVWKVSRVNGWPLISPLCELPLSTDIPDLRIMDFHLLPLVEESQGGVTKYLMVTIYSDSVIKLWILDTSSASFDLISDGRYKTCCLLHANFFVSGFSVFILVGATDGHLSVWNISEILKQYGIQNENGNLIYVKTNASSSSIKDVVPLPPCVRSSQVHQSSVKAFSVLQNLSPLNGNTYYLLTGGDDNALVLSQIKLDDDDTKVSVNLVFSEPSAHSATITSIASVPNTDHVVSTGVDQNVKLWTVTENDFVLLKSMYTTIADTGVCDIADIYGSSIAVIGGSGISTWRI